MWNIKEGYFFICKCFRVQGKLRQKLRTIVDIYYGAIGILFQKIYMQQQQEVPMMVPLNDRYEQSPIRDINVYRQTKI